MKKVMVIGGAGFIGSHVVDELVRRGHDVHVIDNLSSGRLDNIKSHIDSRDIEFYSVDMRSAACRSIIKEVKPHTIFLLAAIPGVPVSVDKPVETNDVNVNGSLNVLSASVGNVKRIVFSSSSSIYGGSENLPTSETEKENCKSPYALQKLTIERYLKLFSKLYDIDTVSLRYFNVFGPRQYPKSAYAAVISAFCECLKSEKNPTIYGNGEQFRDFTYIANVVNANMLSFDYEGDLKGEVFNVGCQKSTTINDLAKYMKLNNALHLSDRPGDVKCSEADISKIKSALGYKVLVTFQEGLQDTINWYLSRRV